MSKSTGEQYVYDTLGSVPLLLQDGTTCFIYGPGGSVVEQETCTSEGHPVFFVDDALGSTQWLVNLSGSVVGTYAYSTYGSTLSYTGTVSTPIGFAGAYTDAETGFLYLVDRYYDPSTDQFLSVDPDLAETGQPYAFTGDDPINNTDPDGMSIYMTNGGGSDATLCSPYGCGPTATNNEDAASAATDPTPSNSLAWCSENASYCSALANTPKGTPAYDCLAGDAGACAATPSPTQPAATVGSPVQAGINDLAPGAMYAVYKIIRNYSGPLSTPSTTRRDAARNVGNSDRRPLPV
jgi:RHS repeat-associated protein